MRHMADSYVFPGVFAPILSLDELMDGGAASEDDDAPSFDVVDPELTADRLIERAEGLNAVRAFVGSLPERDKSVVEGVFWEGQNQTQMAAKLGVSKMAISKRLARVLARARELLADFEFLPT